MRSEPSSSPWRRLSRLGAFRSDSRELRRQLQVAIGLSLVVGVATGAVVAAIHWLIVDALWDRFDREWWWVIALPALGLAGAAIFVARTREHSMETTEEYVRTFHEIGGHIRTSSVPLRLLASTLTIGLGGSMGLEGPSIYSGSAIGDWFERAFGDRLSLDDRKTLLVAGAAAGIAAIFKAPVTGVIFALEVPYRDDLARRALIPSIFAAAASFTTFVSIAGMRPLFPIASATFTFKEFPGALAVGLVCGLGARLFVAAYRIAERSTKSLSSVRRQIIGATTLAAIGAASLALFHRPFALGPGYDAILQAARGRLAVELLLALFGLKLIATVATAMANGVGGLFFPSVLLGAALGGVVGHIAPGPPSLFAVVGIAAFLSGSYNVPLAGVAFVAEATGAPGYIVPGLIAAALAYLFSGPASLSHRQRSRRIVDIDTHLDIRVGEVMSREWVEVPSSATLQDVANDYAIRAKARTLIVADSGVYQGTIAIGALRDVPVERWAATTVGVVLRRDVPVVSVTQKLRDAIAQMRRSGVDRLAVVEGDRVAGTLQTSDVLRLEGILDVLDESEGHQS